MSPPDDEDRGAILARRAAFITSTLSLLHCSPASEPVPPTSTSVVPVEAASGTPVATATASASARTSDSAPERTFDQAMANAPPRGAPASLPEDIRKAAQDLETVLGAAYGDVRALWETKSVPCEPADASCKDAWKALGEGITKLRKSLRDLGGGGTCGRWAGALATLERRRNDHQAFLLALTDELDQRLARVACRGGPTLASDWEAMVAESKQVPPLPCLRCMPPPRSSIGSPIVFDADATTLGPRADAGLSALLEEVKRNDVSTIELVGHADPSEKGDLVTISKKRAEAVAAWLKSKGVAGARLKVLPLGGALPIANDPNENRRVESATLRAR